jgi:hypothetical protein
VKIRCPFIQSMNKSVLRYHVSQELSCHEPCGNPFPTKFAVDSLIVPKPENHRQHHSEASQCFGIIITYCCGFFESGGAKMTASETGKQPICRWMPPMPQSFPGFTFPDPALHGLKPSPHILAASSGRTNNLHLAVWVGMWIPSGCKRISEYENIGHRLIGNLESLRSSIVNIGRNFKHSISEPIPRD